MGGLLVPPSRKAGPAPAVSLRVAMKNALSGNWKGTEPRGQSLKPHIQPSLLEVDESYGDMKNSAVRNKKKAGLWKFGN